MNRSHEKLLKSVSAAFVCAPLNPSTHSLSRSLSRNTFSVRSTLATDCGPCRALEEARASSPPTSPTRWPSGFHAAGYLTRQVLNTEFRVCSYARTATSTAAQLYIQRGNHRLRSHWSKACACARPCHNLRQKLGNHTFNRTLHVHRRKSIGR